MSEEILINVTLMETRVALIENGLLQEIFIERHNKRGYVGDIFQGKVVRVMPGMEAAFVDIGLEKAAFIHVSDMALLGADGFENRNTERKSVQELLREGQSLVVQVAKDAISTKGARLTTHLTLPSRNLVYLPRSHHLGISQRLQDEAEPDRHDDLRDDRDVQRPLRITRALQRAGERQRDGHEEAGHRQIAEQLAAQRERRSVGHTKHGEQRLGREDERGTDAGGEPEADTGGHPRRSRAAIGMARAEVLPRHCRRRAHKSN